MNTKTIECDINLDEFQAFAIFEIYYQLMMSLDINKKCRENINYLMNHHFKKVYSKEYNKSAFDIIDEKYKCIVTLEKN